MVDQPKDGLPAAPEGLDTFLATPVASQQPGAPEGLDAFIEPEMQQEKYGGLGSQALTALEGGLSAATFGLSTGVETALGVNPEDIRGRREANPISHGVGQVAGLVGTAVVPGLGGASAAKIMTKAGLEGAELAGLGAGAKIAAAEKTAAQVAKEAGMTGMEAVDFARSGAKIAAESIPTVDKIGSAAMQGVVENAIFQSGDEVSKFFSQDPAQNVETAAVDIGLAGLVGGAFGGAAGSVSSLWDAAVGSKVASDLSAITKKFGGIEGSNMTALDDLGAKAGVTFSDSARAALGGDELIQSVARTVSHSDSASGKVVQEGIQSLKSSLDESLLSSLGTSSGDVAKRAQMSIAEEGKRVGSTIAKEIEDKVNPILKEFGDLETNYGDIPLGRSVKETAAEFEKVKKRAVSELGRLTKEAQEAAASNSPEKAIAAADRLSGAHEAFQKMSSEASTPGMVDNIAQRVQQLAVEKGWATSPSSDIMKVVNQVTKELPLQKTLKNLNDFEHMVGTKTWDPLDPALSQAGMEIKGAIREFRTNLLREEIGKREGAEAAERFDFARKAFSEVANIKDELNTRLHIKSGGLKHYAKMLREAVETDSETVLRRLTGNGDAHLIGFMQEHFPGTAQALREHEVNKLIQLGMDKAKHGETISSDAIIKQVNKMSPEMKTFVLGDKSISKIAAIEEVSGKIKSSGMTLKPSDRATLNALMDVGNASTMAMALASGNVPAVLLGVGKWAFKDAPDAVRLALLKFMGSNKPIEAGAFKATVDAIQATLKGENQLSKISKEMFKAESKAIGSLTTSARDREKLDKMVQEAQTNPESMLNVGKKIGHYMPEQAMALSATAATAMTFLASQRPDTNPKAPLDSRLPPDPQKMAEYNRMLDIANAPLIVAQKIKHGSVTPKEIAALKTMYPALYNNMAQKFLKDMNKHLAKDGKVPYKTRIGLSLFTGQPLDSTLTGPSIMTAQPKKAQQPQMGQSSQMKPPAASSVKGFSKLATSYETPNQARAQRSQRSK